MTEAVSRRPAAGVRPRTGLRMPWQDRSGNFSGFRAAVLLALVLPGAVLAIQYEAGRLGAQPLNTLIHQVGLWAIRLLFLSLAITPFRQILRRPELVTVRRMIGVAAFVYAALHLGLYAADQAFDLAKVAREIALRAYLTIGATALAVLLALAITSTDGMMKRLGGKRWRALHRWVYAAAALAVIHHFMQAKINIDEACVMAGLFAWLMLYRLAAWQLDPQRLRRVTGLVLLAVLAALFTAGTEYAWYGLATGVDPARVLAANLSWMAAPRPAGIVLAIGLLVTLAPAAAAVLRRLPVLRSA